MNGFEPLRRRIIDYTEAGQWSVVYDGPLEDCESEKLKAENAKLREQLEGIVGRSFRTADKMSCLEAENAKLRELVRDLEVAFIHGPCYRWCEFKEPCNGDKCQYRDRMRELGVEV